MKEVNKIKIAAIIVSIISLLSFFVFILLRKYDPLFNIFKIVTLSLSLMITSIILILGLIKDVKAHKNFQEILLPLVDLMVCILLLPVLSFILPPQSNLFDVYRTPIYDKSYHYDAYHNFIYWNRIDSSPEIIVVQQDPSVLELQFIERTDVFEGYEQPLYVLSDLTMTYDDKHRLLTYDLQVTMTKTGRRVDPDAYMISSTRTSISNTYTEDTFRSVKDYYTFEDTIDHELVYDTINHHAFSPEDAYRSVINSTKTMISTDHYEYLITFEDEDYYHEKYTSYTRASQVIVGATSTIEYCDYMIIDVESEVPQRLNDCVLNHSIITDEDQITVQHRYESEYFQTEYTLFNELPILVKEFQVTNRIPLGNTTKFRVYQTGIGRTIQIENNRSAKELIKIHRTNYGYVLEYYTSESEFNRMNNVGFFGIHIPRSAYLYLDNIHVIYPNAPLLWL